MATDLLPSHDASLDTVLWNRVIHADGPDFTPEFSREVLTWGFAESDRKRIAELLERNRESSITPDEQAALESYERVGHSLNIMQAKARLSLRRAGLSVE